MKTDNFLVLLLLRFFPAATQAIWEDGYADGYDACDDEWESMEDVGIQRSDIMAALDSLATQSLQLPEGYAIRGDE